MVVVIMGVVGSGKTTIGTRLAGKLGWQFADADDFHSADNVERMKKGIGLTDEDRAPWLLALQRAIESWNLRQENVVLACSALKESYRSQLQVGTVRFVYLKGAPALIARRLHARRGHFASHSILESQFSALEEPRAGLTVDIDRAPDAIVDEIIAQLKLVNVSYPNAAIQ